MSSLEHIWDEIEQRHRDETASGRVGWMDIFRISAKDALASGRIIESERIGLTSHALALALIERDETMRWCLVPGWSDYVLGFETEADAIKARLILSDDPHIIHPSE